MGHLDQEITNQLHPEVSPDWHSKDQRRIPLLAPTIFRLQSTMDEDRGSTCSIWWDIHWHALLPTSFHKHIRWNLWHQRRSAVR